MIRKKFLITHKSQPVIQALAKLQSPRPIGAAAMAKNAIQFQAGMSLPKFIEAYGSEPQCQCRAAPMA